MKTISDVVQSISKSLKVKEFIASEDLAHDYNLVDVILDDNITYYSYQEIIFFLSNLSDANIQTIINDIKRRKETRENYRWVRLCKEISRLYIQGGTGKISLNNRYNEPEADMSKFNEIFGSKLF